MPPRRADDDDRSQVEQRDRRPPPDAKDALLAAQQAILAIEHEPALQGRRAGRRARAGARPRERAPTGWPSVTQPGAAGGERPAGPRRRARQIELDARRRPLADLHGAEPVEHVSSVRRSARALASVRYGPSLEPPPPPPPRHRDGGAPPPSPPSPPPPFCAAPLALASATPTPPPAPPLAQRLAIGAEHRRATAGPERRITGVARGLASRLASRLKEADRLGVAARGPVAAPIAALGNPLPGPRRRLRRRRRRSPG